MALLKATEGACVRKELDLSDFWPTGLYLDHQVMCDGRGFLELYVTYCVCVCVRAHTRTCMHSRADAHSSL